MKTDNIVKIVIVRGSTWRKPRSPKGAADHSLGTTALILLTHCMQSQFIIGLPCIHVSVCMYTHNLRIINIIIASNSCRIEFRR